MEDAPTKLAKRAVKCRRRMREIEEMMAKAKEEYAAVQEALPRIFAAAGIKKLTVDGATVYVKRKVFASKKGSVDKETFLAWLKKSDLGDFISTTYAAPSITSHIVQKDAAIREDLKEGDAWEAALKEALPEGAFDMLNIGSKTTGEVRES